MLSHFLKRVLPFVLTLTAGVALGSVFGLFSPRTQTATTNALLIDRRYERSGSCRSSKFQLRGDAGRLVTIKRQTEDGEWVSVRPVTPEIYDLTTRPAIIMSRPQALYTDDALRNSISGSVTLEAVLSPNGRVTDIEPREQLGEGLTVQATMAAQNIQFTPALKDGRPVAQRIMLEYSFGR